MNKNNAFSFIKLKCLLVSINLMSIYMVFAADSSTSNKFSSEVEFPEYTQNWSNEKYDKFYGKSDSIYLNGWWKIFKIKNTKLNPHEDFGRKHNFFDKNVDVSNWDKIFVPWDWNDKNFSKKFKGVGWYRKNFLVPQEYKGRTFILKFHSILSDAEVWVNGKQAGKYKAYYFNNLNNRSLYSACEFDITKEIVPGAENVIAVRVYHSYGKKPRGGIDGPVQINVYPRIYIKRILVTPDIVKSQITIRCLFINNCNSAQEINLNLKLGPWKSYRYIPPDKIKESEFSLGKLSLPQGESEKTLNVPIKEPVFWTYDRPNLYHLCFFSGKTLIGQTRFGFREINIKGRHFFLNGKKMWIPTAQLCPGISRLSNIWAWNQDVEIPMVPAFTFKSKNIKEFFNRYKKQNLNMLRAHTDCWTEPQLDLADEMGMLVYPELATTKKNAIRTPDVGGKSLLEEFNKNNKLPDGAKEIWAKRMHSHWNHPSIWAYSIGNEMYERDYTEFMCAIFQYLKNELKIPFPISQSGRLYIKRSHDKFTPLPDFYDDHYYRTWDNRWEQLEIICSRLKDNFINGKALDRPWLNGECFGVFRVAHYMYLFKEMKKDLPNVDRKKFAELVNKKQPKNKLANSAFGKRNLLLYGIRDFLKEPENGDIRRAEYYKRLAETHRRWNDYVTGFATHRIWPPHLDKMTPLGEMIKRVNSPIYACTNLYFKHHFFAGGKLQTTLYVFNDSLYDAKNLKVDISVLNRAGESVFNKKITVDKLKQGKKREYNLEWEIPATLKTGHYRFQMNIYNDGVREADNSYRIYILGKDERLAGMKTKQRIALYDSGKSKIFKGTKYSSGFTQDILDQFKINYHLCDNFDDLGQYDILIFGANSFDDNVKKNGEKIRQWINNGGKVLCLEQTGFLGPLPFASEYQITDVRDNRFTFADLLVPQHPIFKGLEVYDWDMWDGGTLGRIGGKVILPLADSALAVSGSHGIPGMLVTEFRIGKGTVLVSLAEALFQYNKDSVASKYVENLLKYALSDKTEKLIPNYTIPEIKGNKIKEYSIPKLAADKSFFIDLRKHANRSFIDKKGSDGIGGWFDEGKNQDLKDFPVGQQEFKGVPFDIIEPSKNNEKSCIVLNTKRNKRYPVGNRKDQVEITVNRKAKRLIFLVASAWCSEQGPPMAEFTVKFQGGECLDETTKFDLTPGVNISDWFIKGGNLPGARLAWTTFDRRAMSKVGVWMFQWENSQPQANISKIIFKTKHTMAIPALIAITGEKF